uniref:Uncharacterized protein n=1 Tax=Peronospora matthiolae TaxID=2874970 RepID=A0AAV1TII0_9STRA
MPLLTAKPQLDDAIAYLQAEIAALCAGERDDKLVELAVAVAAGDPPLPEPQFAPLLALWTPQSSSLTSDLGALVDEFEAARRQEKREEEERREQEGKRHVESALERVRGQRRRPRTRPRRRFEDPDERDAREAVGDGTSVTSCRESNAGAGAVEEAGMGVEEKEEEKEAVKVEGLEKKEQGEERGEVEVNKVNKVEEETKQEEEMTEVGKGEEVEEMKDVEVEEVKVEKEEEKVEDMGKQKEVKGERERGEEMEEKVDEVEKQKEVEDEGKRGKEMEEEEEVKEDDVKGERAKKEEDLNVGAMNDVEIKEGQDDSVEEKVTEKEQVTGEDEVSMEEKKDGLVEKEERRVKEQVVVEERKSKKQEAEAALASLKVLRQNMLLDVLSKIVSVAKSKDVDPAMFTKNGEAEKVEAKHQVDLEKVQVLVTSGVICEWAQFAEQVYLFCQHVVTDAERREQPEARRKGIELLHFARTLTETLRKASIKKEDILLQKIREAEEEAVTRTEKVGDACNEEAEHVEEAEETFAGEIGRRAAEGTAGNNDLNSQALASELFDLRLLSPTRASSRIRKRTSITSDGTGSAVPSPSSQNTRKRTRGASVSAASASEEVSASESHDASASEADPKSHRHHNMSKTHARRTPARRSRPSIPATRISSRQQKRRAVAAAAAAAVNSAGSGQEEGHSGGEALYVAVEREGNDVTEEQNGEEVKIEGDELKQDEEELSTPKKKKAAPRSRSRKKGGRKR